MIFQNPFENWIHSNAPIKVKCRVKTRGLLHPCVVLEVDEPTRFIVEGYDFQGEEICLGNALFLIGDSPVHVLALIVQAVSMYASTRLCEQWHSWEGFSFEGSLVPRIENMEAIEHRSLFSNQFTLLGVSLILPTKTTSSP